MEDKLKIARVLDGLGVHYIEGGWPGSNPKDAEFFRRMREAPLATARIAAFGSTRRAGTRCEEDGNIRALVDAATPVVTLVGKTSTLHVDRVLETTREENLGMIGESVAWFKRLGREVVYDAEHFFDGWRLDPAYALATLAAAAAKPAPTGSCCATPTAGSCPRSCAERVARAARPPRRAARHPPAQRRRPGGRQRPRRGARGLRAGAGHDQRLRRALRQRRPGAARSPPCSSSWAAGADRRSALRRLTEVSHYVAEVANQHPDPHAPYVGRSAFAHKGGIHVAAIAKVPESYQHVDPAAVGNEMPRGGQRGGRARNVRLRAAASWGSPPARMRRAVLQRIKELEHQGFQFEAAEGSFEMLLRRTAPGYQRALRAGRLHRHRREARGAAEAGRRRRSSSGSATR